MEFSIAKQPIVDHNLRLVGYELLYRSAAHETTAIINQDINPTDNVLSGYFLFNLYSDSLTENIYFINCTEQDLFSNKISLLPSNKTVIEVLETCLPSPELCDQIIALKNRGYTIALDDITPDSPWIDYIHLADIAKIDILDYQEHDLSDVIAKCKKYNVKLLAEKVEDEEQALYYHSLGFDYFQGYYFCRPITLNLEILAPSAINLLETYSYLYNNDFEINSFIKLLTRDASLTATLISRVNRHYRLVGKRISNIKHAIAYLGLSEVKKIVATILASKISHDSDTFLYTLSVSRAQFLESIVQSIPVIIKRYEAYSVGLFSLFDAILKVDMNSLCSFMHIPENLAKGLVHHNGFWGDMIRLCIAFEEGNFDLAESLAAQYSLSYEELLTTYWENY